MLMGFGFPAGTFIGMYTSEIGNSKFAGLVFCLSFASCGIIGSGVVGLSYYIIEVLDF